MCQVNYCQGEAEQTPPPEKECEHKWVTYLIQMPQGYGNPGRTACSKCGVIKLPQQFSDRAMFTPLDLDRQTKPLHVEIEGLKADVESWRLRAERAEAKIKELEAR